MTSNKNILHDAISHEVENNILCIKLPKSKQSIPTYTRNLQQKSSNSADRSCVKESGQKCKGGTDQTHVIVNKNPAIKTPEQEALLIRTKQETIDNKECRHTLEIHLKGPRNYVPLQDPGPVPRIINPKPYRRKQQSVVVAKDPYLECECIERRQPFTSCACDKIKSKSKLKADRKRESSSAEPRVKDQTQSLENNVHAKSELAISKGHEKSKSLLRVLKDDDTSTKDFKDEAKLKGQPRTVEDKDKSKGRKEYVEDKDKSKGRKEYVEDKDKSKGRKEYVEDKDKSKGRKEYVEDKDKSKGRKEYVEDKDKSKGQKEYVEDKDKPQGRKEYVEDKDKPQGRKEYAEHKDKPQGRKEYAEHKDKPQGRKEYAEDKGKSTDRKKYMDDDLLKNYQESESAKEHRKRKSRLESAKEELTTKRRAESARADHKTSSGKIDFKHDFRVRRKSARKPQTSSYLECIGHYKNKEKHK